jgi:hypothetical protein
MQQRCEVCLERDHVNRYRVVAKTSLVPCRKAEYLAGFTTANVSTDLENSMTADFRAFMIICETGTGDSPRPRWCIATTDDRSRN